MSNRKYPIKRWDSFLFGNYLGKIPSFYIKPDESFLDFIRANKFAVMCEISDTDKAYNFVPDQETPIRRPGIVNKSSVVPNCRPNFFEETGLYVVTLPGTPWLGYPSSGKLGTVKFFGINDKPLPTPTPPPSPSPSPSPPPPPPPSRPKYTPLVISPPTPQKNGSNHWILGIIISIVLISVYFFLVYKVATAKRRS